MNKKKILEGVVSGLVIGGVVLGGCDNFRCERDRWYFQKRKDLISRVEKDPYSDVVDKAIISAAEKLERSIYPEYFKFPNIDKTPADFVERNKKKKLGVIDIYAPDENGLRIFDNYVTDFLVSAIMSNVKLGENFRVIERYKLKTLLKEQDIKKESVNLIRGTLLKEVILRELMLLLQEQFITNHQKHMKEEIIEEKYL